MPTTFGVKLNIKSKISGDTGTIRRTPKKSEYSSEFAADLIQRHTSWVDENTGDTNDAQTDFYIVNDQHVLANNRHFINKTAMEYQPNGDATTEGQSLQILGYLYAYMGTSNPDYLAEAIAYWQAYVEYFYAGQPIPDTPQRWICNWIINGKEPILANYPVDAAEPSHSGFKGVPLTFTDGRTVIPHGAPYFGEWLDKVTFAFDGALSYGSINAGVKALREDGTTNWDESGTQYDVDWIIAWTGDKIDSDGDIISSGHAPAEHGTVQLKNDTLNGDHKLNFAPRVPLEDGGYLIGRNEVQHNRPLHVPLLGSENQMGNAADGEVWFADCCYLLWKITGDEDYKKALDCVLFTAHEYTTIDSADRFFRQSVDANTPFTDGISYDYTYPGDQPLQYIRDESGYIQAFVNVTPEEVAPPPYSLEIWPSDEHGLARAPSGEVVLIGGDFDDNEGQLDIPVDIGLCKKVQTEYYKSMLLKENGSLVFFGLEEFDMHLIPGSLGPVADFAMGEEHVLALEEGGAVVAWGLNGDNQLDVPAGLGEVVSVHCGSFTNYLLMADKTVVAWGFNGEPGYPEYGTPATIPGDLTGVLKIATGYYHVAFLIEGGTVRTIGSYDLGQQSVPVGLSGVVDVMCCYDTVFALKSDGTVVIWGDNPGDIFTPPPEDGPYTFVGARANNAYFKKADGNIIATGVVYNDLTIIPAELDPPAPSEIEGADLTLEQQSIVFRINSASKCRTTFGGLDINGGPISATVSLTIGETKHSGARVYESPLPHSNSLDPVTYDVPVTEFAAIADELGNKYITASLSSSTDYGGTVVTEEIQESVLGDRKARVVNAYYPDDDAAFIIGFWLTETELAPLNTISYKSDAEFDLRIEDDDGWRWYWILPDTGGAWSTFVLDQSEMVLSGYQPGHDGDPDPAAPNFTELDQATVILENGSDTEKNFTLYCVNDIPELFNSADGWTHYYSVTFSAPSIYRVVLGDCTIIDFRVDSLDYCPGVIPFSNIYQEESEQIGAWHGLPYPGYQAPVIYALEFSENDFTKLNNCIDFLYDSQRAFYSQFGELGPGASAYVWDRWDALEYGDVGTWTMYHWGDSRAWSGYQPRAFSWAARAWQELKYRNRPVPQKLIDYCENWLVWLAEFVSINGTSPDEFNPDGTVDGGDFTGHMVGLWLSGACYCQMAGTQYSDEAETLMEICVKQLSDEIVYIEPGHPMNGSWSPYAGGGMAFGFWTGEILRGLGLYMMTRRDLRPSDFYTENSE